MKLGFIGLGKMGENMVTRLLNDGHNIVANDLDHNAVERVEKNGAEGSTNVRELLDKLDTPRVVWLMVPSGEVTGDTISYLLKYLDEGDIIVDGGNSYYKDTIKRNKECNSKKIHLIDAGTSGGIWGLKLGYCQMIGGEENIFQKLEPIFKTLAPKNGYAYMGTSGAGHYVKMIHNGIEYGMMQAYAEGFALMEASNFNVDLEKTAHLWNQGSVVRSWLLELTEEAFKKDSKLENIKGYVEDSGEGRWTILDSLEKNIPCPVIAQSLLYRFGSRQKEPFAAKVLAALRNEFGGHKVKRSNSDG